MNKDKKEKIARNKLLKYAQAIEMYEDKEERLPRKKLPKYAIHGDLFVSIFTIVTSIVWMMYIISMFYPNQDSDIEESGVVSVFLLIGCLILVSGIYKLIKAIKQKNLKERLFQEGNRLIATVVDIESEGMMLKLGEFQMMGRGSGFKIHAKYEDRNFISAKIGINVLKYVEIGDKIPVFVDLHNPEEYYMDLDNINSI